MTPVHERLDFFKSKGGFELLASCNSVYRFKHRPYATRMHRASSAFRMPWRAKCLEPVTCLHLGGQKATRTYFDRNGKAERSTHFDLSSRVIPKLVRRTYGK